MYKILSVENMRKSDAYTIANFVPSKELMYRAGKGAFDATMEFFECEDKDARICSLHSPIAIVCGSGNNAGDGYVMAELFFNAGADVTLILLKEKFSADGQYYFDKCRELGIPVKIFSQEPELDFGQFRLIVDCILGTGFKGDVRGVAAEAIEAINEAGSGALKSGSCEFVADVTGENVEVSAEDINGSCEVGTDVVGKNVEVSAKFPRWSDDDNTKVVSIDINSGLNGDTGQAKLAVKSDLTISIGGFKTGHFLGEASTHIKELTNVDIGIKPVDKPFLLVSESEVDKLSEKERNENHVVTSLQELEGIISGERNWEKN